MFVTFNFTSTRERFGRAGAPSLLHAYSVSGGGKTARRSRRFFHVTGGCREIRPRQVFGRKPEAVTAANLPLGLTVPPIMPS